MEFTQLLSIAHRNANKQVTPAVKAPVGGKAASNEPMRKQPKSASNRVSENAVQDFLQDKRQAFIDKERQRMEEKRKLLDERLAKKMSAKQKAKEEQLAKTFEALKQEEMKQRLKTSAAANQNHLPKNNIKSQYNCNGAPPATAAPKAPMDYQTIKRMAEKNVSSSSTTSQVIPPHVRLKQDKEKKLEDELVHFKQPKPLKDSQTRKNSHSSSATPLSSLNRENLVKKPSQGALHGKGILAQLGAASNSQNDPSLRNNRTPVNGSSVSGVNNRAKTTTENNRNNTNGAKNGHVSKKGILAQLGAGSMSSGYQTSSSSSSVKSEESSVKTKKKTCSGDGGSLSRKRSYDEIDDVRGPLTQSRYSSASRAAPLPTHMRPAAPRGIAAQLGISTAAKHRFEQERERQYFEEEEEDYDSELDDFIDDGEDDEYYQQQQEALAEMRRITGYDPTRYRDQDISDYELRRSMTASVSDILKEEKRSERIGRKEDAIEFRKEQERAKKKLEAKKTK